MIYAKDNRPHQDLYDVAVWDLNEDLMVATAPLGAVHSMIKVKNGFAFSKIVPRSDIDTIKMTSKWGREMTAGDDDLKALHVVTIEGRHLEMKVDPDLSYENSEWKSFFKDKADYLKAAGWDSSRKKFKNQVVYKASHFDRKESDEEETCINLTDQRGGNFVEPQWRCIKEKH